MKRLAEFLRSVIPNEPWQLVFLLGVVFLFVSPSLPWWPTELLESFGLRSTAWQSGTHRFEAGRFIVAFTYPIMFAGLAGYFVCFWPGKRPVRRVLLAVCFPTVFSLVVILWKFFQINPAKPSIFESQGSAVYVINWLQTNVLKFSSGFSVCALGLMLILFFMSRLALGATSLQFGLPNEQLPRDDCADSWSRMRLLVFLLVGPYYLLAGLVSFLLLGVPDIVSLSLSPTFWAISTSIATVLDGVLLAGLALYILGRDGRNSARIALRLPELRIALWSDGHPRCDQRSLSYRTIPRRSHSLGGIRLRQSSRTTGIVHLF